MRPVVVTLKPPVLNVPELRVSVVMPVRSDAAVTVPPPVEMVTAPIGLAPDQDPAPVNVRFRPFVKVVIEKPPPTWTLGHVAALSVPPPEIAPPTVRALLLVVSVLPVSIVS